MSLGKERNPYKWHNPEKLLCLAPEKTGGAGKQELKAEAGEGRNGASSALEVKQRVCSVEKGWPAELHGGDSQVRTNY